MHSIKETSNVSILRLFKRDPQEAFVQQELYSLIIIHLSNHRPFSAAAGASFIKWSVGEGANTPVSDCAVLVWVPFSAAKASFIICEFPMPYGAVCESAADPQ